MSAGIFDCVFYSYWSTSCFHRQKEKVTKMLSHSLSKNVGINMLHLPLLASACNEA